MAEQPALRLVDPETGELGEEIDGCKECHRLKMLVQALEKDIDNLEADLRGKRAQIKALKSDREKEARNHPQREAIEELFAYWCEKCNHPRSKLDAERTFRLAWGIEHYGMAMSKLAIDGAAFDPWVRRRKNGTLKKFDELKLIFRDAPQLEDFVCRADPAALAAWKREQAEQEEDPDAAS